MRMILTQAEAKVLAVVQERRCLLLEQLLRSLPELTWNQTFSIVDGLSRRELISLRRRGFEYELQAMSPSLRQPAPAGVPALSSCA
jgi:hypothetical protein